MYIATADHVKAYELLVRQRRWSDRRRVAADAAPARQALRIVLHVRPA